MKIEQDIRNSLDELRQLNQSRYEYVLARSQSSSVSEALAACGRSSAWFYTFHPEERDRMEQIAMDIRHQRTLQAELLLQQAATDAARVLVDDLKYGRDRRVRQQAAKEILDRVGLVKVEKIEADVTENVNVTRFDDALQRIYGDQS